MGWGSKILGRTEARSRFLGSVLVEDLRQGQGFIGCVCWGYFGELQGFRSMKVNGKKKQECLGLKI